MNDVSNLHDRGVERAKPTGLGSTRMLDWVITTVVSFVILVLAALTWFTGSSGSVAP